MLVTLPGLHPGILARPSTPKVLRIKERVPTLYSSVVFTLDLHLSLSKSLGARHLNHIDYLIHQFLVLMEQHFAPQVLILMEQHLPPQVLVVMD